jgi:hypothetical protein
LVVRIIDDTRAAIHIMQNRRSGCGTTSKEKRRLGRLRIVNSEAGCPPQIAVLCAAGQWERLLYPRHALRARSQGK